LFVVTSHGGYWNREEKRGKGTGVVARDVGAGLHVLPAGGTMDFHRCSQTGVTGNRLMPNNRQRIETCR